MQQSNEPRDNQSNELRSLAGLSSQLLIRNFCIIAHIDHGKSTLADRLLELTETVTKREMKEQLLDQMDLEREKGITIKLAPVRMACHLKHEATKLFEPEPQSRRPKSETNQKPETTNSKPSEFRNSNLEFADSIEYQLNLIDTPGHVDFSYEVSRSLQACEGALLVVDASQGIQAQTLANVYLALEQDLTIIPVMNKIDLPAADVDKVGDEIVKLLGCKREDILQVSAKTGKGVDQVLERIVSDIPPPDGKVFVNPERQVAGSAHKQDEMVLAPLRCLIFDSVYDEYRGVILYVRVVDGQLKKSENIRLMAAQTEGIALEIGALKPTMTAMDKLGTGEIGYIVTNLKSVAEAKVGDTVTSAKEPASLGLPGYREVKPFVYAGIFPNSSDDYPLLKDALEKLTLSDSALRYAPENSSVLGHGFRIGFLGLLHLEIVKERLERTHNTDVVVTNPSTDYQVKLVNGEELTIKSASELPNVAQIAEIREPWIKGEIVVPKEYLGGVLQLIVAGRGLQKNLSYLDEQLALISFEAPLANMLTDFYDQLKSITSGYGSFSYELDDYRAEELVKLDFLVANERVDSLSLMVHRSETLKLGREIVAKLKEIIPRQLFEVSLQAAVGGKIIAREDVKALGKNVTGHLYGGDVSRKKKLWAKQKAGKARMKKFGKVEIPNEAFTVLLKKG